jgi:photosystem II stability/assembly factor-like uncharacterized protein
MRSTGTLAIVVLCWFASAGAADANREVIASAATPRSPTPIEDDAQLHDLVFVSTRVGWAAGDHGVIWHTDDAGATWSLQATATRSPIYSVCFLTDRVGWAAGGRTVPFTRTGEGELLKTTDGGATWSEVAAGSFPRLHFVRFFSPDKGIVAGEATPLHPSGVLLTQDGGRTWRDLFARGEVASNWRAADFVRLDRGAVVGRRGQTRLIDGAGLFAPQRSDWGLRGLHDIVLKPGGLAWMVGDGGLVLRSTNSGLAWQTPNGGLPEETRDLFDFRAVAARESSTSEKIWVAGDPGSVVWHSGDGGRTWTRQRTGQALPIHAITFASDKVGWAAGACGLILRTIDGGSTWETVRGGTRRAAVVSFPAEPQRTSLPLVAQLGGELGYRTLTCVLPRHDVGSEKRTEFDVDVHLREAVTAVGGSASQIAWQFPMTIPGLERNTEKLVADWTYRTEGRLSELLVGQLVKLLRTWRPTVVVLDHAAEHDALTKLINQAITRAVKDAADATRFPDQMQIAGLPTWRVSRIFERLPSGSAGPVQVDPSQFLPHLGQTARAAAASAAGRLFDRAESFGRETYRILDDDTETRRHGDAGTEPDASLRVSASARPRVVSASTPISDFFTGIPIATGSDARRDLPPLRDLDLDRQQKLARHERNIDAYLDRFLNDPRHAANLLGQTQNVIGQLPPDQAAWRLAQIAELHRRNGQWELAEVTLTELIERFPDQPVAYQAMQRMIQAWIGLEPSWQRLRTSSVGQRQIVGDPASAAKQIEQARAKFELAGGTKSKLPVAPADVGTESPLRTAGYSVATRPDERIRAWWKLADRWAAHLKQHHPAIYSSPQVQFPLAAMYRQRGQLGEAEAVFSFFGREGATHEANAWMRSAKAEQWLAHPINLPPKSFAICRAADGRPVLDGILSDACWEAADELPLATAPAGGVAGTDHSFVMLCRDREYLYVAASLVRHPAAPTDPPQRGARPRDADLADFDRLSIALDIDRDYATYFQFVVDQRGMTADDCWGDPTWNPRWFATVHADATHWRIEAAIPLAELSPRTPMRGEVWNVGITRTIPAVTQESWSQPATRNPQPETFGLVRFE